jgi:protein required for attachment to host cells
MNKVWILVCDAARGRLFEHHSNKPSWRLVEEFDHPASRDKATELVSDHSGQRSSQGASTHHNALAPSSSPKEVEKGHFAHVLATRLDHGMRSQEFRRWVLVAPPQFLGMMKHELTSELEKHLMTTVDKDLSHLDARALAVKLHEAVQIPLDQREI